MSFETKCVAILAGTSCAFSGPIIVADPGHTTFAEQYTQLVDLPSSAHVT